MLVLCEIYKIIANGNEVLEVHIANLDISDLSEWVTATPAAGEMLPFYITEIGRFHAGAEYFTERDLNDSHMLLYTLYGEGALETDGGKITLSSGDAAVIDCMKRHRYSTKTAEWDFIWLHIKGAGVSGMAGAVNSNGVSAVKVRDRAEFEEILEGLLSDAKRSDLKTLSGISLAVHSLFDIMLSSEISDRRGVISHIAEIENAIRFIHRHFADAVSIDDMAESAHLSKFYFIRLFRAYTGATPYNYLMNYRVNRSKILLRTTDLSISEIAARTGFFDTSNFIACFKRQTNQKPTEYRRDFS